MGNRFEMNDKLIAFLKIEFWKILLKFVLNLWFKCNYIFESCEQVKLSFKKFIAFRSKNTPKNSYIQKQKEPI